MADDDGDVVGVLVLEDQADHLLLDVLAVAPGRQGRGVGRGRMDLAEDQASERGFSEVRLYTNARMTEDLAYYLRRGYVETHRDEVERVPPGVLRQAAVSRATGTTRPDFRA